MSNGEEDAGEPSGGRLARRLRDGETLVIAWSAIAHPMVAETLARSPYDAVTLDMQHGGHTTDSVFSGITACRLAGKPALVRIPLGRFDMASRALDFGAEAVVAPMINSAEDAAQFAAAMKFPPMGKRSWGPARAMALHGYAAQADYLARANTDTLAIAMVETRAGLAALDGILSVAGIDGVLVGPSDLSIAWTDGATVDPVLDDVMPAMADIAARTLAAGKIPASFAVAPAMVRRYGDMGYRLIALSTDTGCLMEGARALVSGARA